MTRKPVPYQIDQEKENIPDFNPNTFLQNAAQTARGTEVRSSDHRRLIEMTPISIKIREKN
ncbi:hypothetical protein D5R40_16865 [Okeania hirsuta]|uniref:Uncharacterized protein n=1 Tax=Okeania hirsuta TaxID=1458930 RepID=A0A3N6REJ0_9CYAN|nr:hypothetical protein D4Z78_11710 [Okeania hirsuta]RQH39601.1 hypothetical protein D5R40_16865 [Okeania hirsuta]